MLLVALHICRVRPTYVCHSAYSCLQQRWQQKLVAVLRSPLEHHSLISLMVSTWTALFLCYHQPIPGL